MNIPTENKPRWERRKDERPQELLAAALDLFVDKGFAATRLNDVAARAGVSKGTLYLYFTNKEDLFKAVVRENLVPLLDEAEALIDSFDGHSADLFRDIMLGWWQRIGDTKLSGITKLMMAESGNFPELAQFYHKEMIVRGNAMISRILERGVARGEFRAIDPHLTTQAIIAPMIMQYQKPLKSKRDSGKPKGYEESTLSVEEQTLFDKLRWWRVETARKNNVPAYVIFHDATLRDIAKAQPRSIDDLRGVTGVGEKKLETYGEQIVALIAELI